MSELSKRCEGKWPSIVMALGLLDAKAIAGRDVPCPICGGRDRFRFSDKGIGRWYCRGCGRGGDGVKLVMAVTGVGEFAEAANLIEGVVGKAGVYSAKGVGYGRGDGGADTRRDPLRSWREAHPDVLDTVAHTYLKGRGIQLMVAEAAALRFHPSLWHWPTKSKWPAMVALVKRADGVELTAHQTFLEPEGSSKAPVDRPRLFPKGGLVAGGGVWFGEADPAREFIVAEGIESALSAMRLYGAPSGCAALSASGIRFLNLPPAARRVRVFADHDELQQGLAAAGDAARRWRAEGREAAVSYAREAGEDANDVWMKRAKVSPA